MTIYFVRHGEAVDQKRFHQSPDSALSELGRRQIAQLIPRLAQAPIQRVICSDYLRARQSADILATALNKGVVESSLFREVRRPSEFAGRDLQDETIMEIKKSLVERYQDPEWHHSDEENYHDFLTRAREATSFLEKQEVDSLLVVTHENFLKVLTLSHLLGSSLRPETYLHFYYHSVMNNAGLTIVNAHKGEWKLLTWNEHAHLHN